MNKEDQFLKKILEESSRNQGPRLDFSANVMRKIEAKKQQKAAPLIGRFGWAIILISFITIGVYALNQGNGNYSQLDEYFDGIQVLTSNQGFRNGFMIFGIAVILILVDEIIRRKRHQPINK